MDLSSPVCTRTAALELVHKSYESLERDNVHISNGTSSLPQQNSSSCWPGGCPPRGHAQSACYARLCSWTLDSFHHAAHWKDKGQSFLTRLRVIHLFKADYNLFLKVVNVSLEKGLVRQTKSNSSHMDNDATGCYDRIVNSVGMMASRRLGINAHAARCQAETLRKMKYSVKHAFGTSTSYYTSSDDAPLFGTGHGSGASPVIWLGVAVILLSNSLDHISTEDNIPGLAFSDPWNDFSEQWRVGAFVDDTIQEVMDPIGQLSRVELVDQIRRAGQTLEKLLHISGGCLDLAKCSWTL